MPPFPSDTTVSPRASRSPGNWRKSRYSRYSRGNIARWRKGNDIKMHGLEVCDGYHCPPRSSTQVCSGDFEIPQFKTLFPLVQRKSPLVIFRLARVSDVAAPFVWALVLIQSSPW